MQKTKIKAIALTVLLTMILAALPLAAKASTGYILINTTTPPSTVGQTVSAGGMVNLYLGGVTWSGGQFYLLLSRDGYSQVSSGDIKFTPTFNLANLTQATPSNYTTADGEYWIGNDWANVTLPLELGGGNYFVKAFDGTATSVAVTDTYITVIGTLVVVPGSGPGGASITLKGYAFTPNKFVNLSYFDPVAASWVTIKTLHPTDDLGKFEYAMLAPDLKKSLADVDSYNVIFRANDTQTKRTYEVTFVEYTRRLIQVNGYTTPVGNNTDLTASVAVGVSQPVIVAGKWFRPGTVALLWDNTINLGSTTANQTGFFNTTITVPETTVGGHYITLVDGGPYKFVVKITVTPSLVLVPAKGPIGTTVTAKGYGFSARTATTVYNVTLSWEGYVDFDIKWALTDNLGRFVATFTVPHDYGGAHDVTATENGTLITATTTFTITPTIVVSPSTFSNNGSLVNVVGTGFYPNGTYTANIDNRYLGANNDAEWTTPLWANETGDLVVTFIAAGFTPGLHVFSLYPEAYASPYAPAAYVLFTVTAEGDPLNDLLSNMNSTLYEVKSSADAAVSAAQNATNAANAAAAAAVGAKSSADSAVSAANAAKSAADAAKSSADAAKSAADAAKSSADAAKSSADSAVSAATGAKSSADSAVSAATGAKSSADSAKSAADSAVSAANAAKSSADSVSIPVWIAVVLALIAAIAAIYAVITIRKKIAG